MFLLILGIGAGFGSLQKGACSSHYILPQHIAFISLQWAKRVFNFQSTKVWFLVLPCFHHIFSKTTFFPINVHL